MQELPIPEGENLQVYEDINPEPVDLPEEDLETFTGIETGLQLLVNNIDNFPTDKTIGFLRQTIDSVQLLYRSILEIFDETTETEYKLAEKLKQVVESLNLRIPEYLTPEQRDKKIITDLKRTTVKLHAILSKIPNLYSDLYHVHHKKPESVYPVLEAPRDQRQNDITNAWFTALQTSIEPILDQGVPPPTASKQEFDTFIEGAIFPAVRDYNKNYNRDYRPSEFADRFQDNSIKAALIKSDKRWQAFNVPEPVKRSLVPEPSKLKEAVLDTGEVDVKPHLDKLATILIKKQITQNEWNALIGSGRWRDLFENPAVLGFDVEGIGFPKLGRTKTKELKQYWKDLYQQLRPPKPKPKPEPKKPTKSEYQKLKTEYLGILHFLKEDHPRNQKEAAKQRGLAIQEILKDKFSEFDPPEPLDWKVHPDVKVVKAIPPPPPPEPIKKVKAIPPPPPGSPQRAIPLPKPLELAADSDTDSDFALDSSDAIQSIAVSSDSDDHKLPDMLDRKTRAFKDWRRQQTNPRIRKIIDQGRETEFFKYNAHLNRIQPIYRRVHRRRRDPVFKTYHEISSVLPHPMNRRIDDNILMNSEKEQPLGAIRGTSAALGDFIQLKMLPSVIYIHIQKGVTVNGLKILTTRIFNHVQESASKIMLETKLKTKKRAYNPWLSAKKLSKMDEGTLYNKLISVTNDRRKAVTLAIKQNNATGHIHKQWNSNYTLL